MKYLSLFSVVLLAGCVTFGVRERGNGEMVSETYNISEFSKIQIGGAYEILLVPSNKPRVEVEIDDNLVEYLQVDVRGSTLEIYNLERISSAKGIDVIIYYSEPLERIQVSGACDMENEDVLESDRLVIEMTGAGAVDLEIEVDELRLDISGAGAVRLEGNTDHQVIQMSGAGGYGGYGLISNTARIDITGVGSADVTVMDELDATISGVGGINYKGNPENVQSDISGIGSIRNAD